MNRFTNKVAKFITQKFLVEDMNVLKEQFRQEEISKVHHEMEHYKSVINKLQIDKNELSSLKFKEQINIQTKSKNIEKDNNVQIENPYADYL